VANGTLGPLYIETSKTYENSILELLPPETFLEYIPKTKDKKSRRGERGYVAFMEKSFGDHTLNEGDLFITDNEKSLKTELGRDLETSHGVVIFLI
jgi:hypothetical protein